MDRNSWSWAHATYRRAEEEGQAESASRASTPPETPARDVPRSLRSMIYGREHHEPSAGSPPRASPDSAHGRRSTPWYHYRDAHGARHSQEHGVTAVVTAATMVVQQHRASLARQQHEAREAAAREYAQQEAREAAAREYARQLAEQHQTTSSERDAHDLQLDPRTASENGITHSSRARQAIWEDFLRAQLFTAALSLATFEGQFRCGNGAHFQGRYDTGADDNFVTLEAVYRAGMAPAIQRTGIATFYRVSSGAGEPPDDHCLEGSHPRVEDEDDLDAEVEHYIRRHQSLTRPPTDPDRDASPTTPSQHGGPSDTPAAIEIIGARVDVSLRVRLRWLDCQQQQIYEDWFYVLRESPYDMLLGAAFVFGHGILSPAAAPSARVMAVMPLVRVPPTREERAAELERLRQLREAQRRAQQERQVAYAEQHAEQSYSQSP